MNIILFEGEIIPSKISLQDERGKHINKILKLGIGGEFSCGLVNGPSGIGKITLIDEEGIHFDWVQTAEPAALHPLVLLIGYTRPICSKRILREAASLGVERIVLTGTDTGEKSYRSSTLWEGEYRRYLMDGAQQAASTSVPQIDFFGNPDTFFRETAMFSKAESKPAISDYECVILDNVQPDLKLSEYTPAGSRCLLAVGSERGWSDRERILFREYNFIFAGLGSRVLRTETASTAGITLMLARMGLI